MRNAKAATPRSLLGRVRFAAFYVAYVGLWFIAAHYLFFWRPFVAKLREQGKPPASAPATTRYIDALTARRLGMLTHFRKPSFADAAPEKKSGAKRVCAFGDSFTYGDEVPAGYDYPAFLRQALERRGWENVEVINFGATWAGFHQVYLLWEAAGTQLDCDYVLLGPSCFQYYRDTTFNHTETMSPYFLHARFVLDGDDVRLVDVPGETHAERFAEYVRFFPRWQYLRYDRNPPPTLLAALPEGTTLPNPFYYDSRTMENEALATYRVLLRRLVQSARHTVLLHEAPKVVDAAANTGLPNVAAALAYTAKHFPYLAPGGHYSTFGNQMVAAQYLAQIVDPSDDRLTILETENPPPQAFHHADPPLPLSTFHGIEVRLADRPVGWLANVSRHPLPPGSVTASALEGTSVTGLFAVKGIEETWLDAVYAPVDFVLRPGTEVVAQIESPAGEPAVSLGGVRLLDPRVNIGAVNVPDLRAEVRRGKVLLETKLFGLAGRRFTIRVGDRVVHRGVVGTERTELLPLGDNKYWRFRPIESHFVDVSALPPTGTFDLVVEHPERGTMRAPIGSWRKVGVPMPRPRHPLAERLRLPAAD